MYEPIRGGTRGGQAEFKWTDVSADKDREHYLGHSINAPTGRWQKNKDVHWYNRDLNASEEEKRAEIRRIKEAEEEAMAQALGFAPTKKSLDASSPTGEHAGGPNSSGSNAIPVDSGKAAEKEERRLHKLEKRAKKAEKKARKELRRAREKRDRSLSDDDSNDDRNPRSHRRPSSRERDPVGRSQRSPNQHRRSASPPRRRYDNEKYGAEVNGRDKMRRSGRDGDASRSHHGGRY